MMTFCQRITVFDASNNEITELPTSFGDLKYVRVVRLSHNSITDWTPVLGCCRCEELDLSFNTVHEIPAGIASMTSLISLDLSNNQLLKLPQGLTKVTNQSGGCIHWTIVNQSVMT